MKKNLLVLAIILIAIQFYRPNKNEPKKNEKDFLVYENAPKNIKDIFKRACYDCHSNHTEYKWFDNIAPISWIVDKNIHRAKLSLNFSKWGELEPWQRRLFLQGAIPYDIKIDKMPPKEYLFLHNKANLSKEDKLLLNRWLESIDFTKE